MSSSVAPLALSHALRRWIHNAPQDQQTRASGIETLRDDEITEAVELLSSSLMDDPTLRWLAGVDAGESAAQNGVGTLPTMWKQSRIVRWVSAFLIKMADRVLVCHSAETGQVDGVACILQPSGARSNAESRLESVRSELERTTGPMMGGDPAQQRAEWLWRKSASLRTDSLPHKEIIGVRRSMIVSAAHSRESAWHVLAIATRPEIRGRGIGSLLLAEVAALGAVSQHAVVAQCSASSHGLFTRRGYSIAGRLRVGADDRVDLSLSQPEMLDQFPSSNDVALRVLYRPAMDRAGRNLRDTWQWVRSAGPRRPRL